MKPATLIATLLLLLIATAHLLRLFFRWEVMVNGALVPIWISALSCIFLAGLAWMLWRESHR